MSTRLHFAPYLNGQDCLVRACIPRQAAVATIKGRTLMDIKSCAIRVSSQMAKEVWKAQRARLDRYIQICTKTEPEIHDYWHKKIYK